MMNGFNRLIVGGVVFVVLAHDPGSARAQQCTADQLAASVDQAGAALRDIMRVNQPRLDQKIAALKAKTGWSDAEADEKALEALSDTRTAELDRTANDLLARIDQLGNLPGKAVPDCTRLQELDVASLELQAAVKAKTAYMLARADGLLGAGSPPSSAAASAQVPAPPPAPSSPPVPLPPPAQMLPPKAPPPIAAAPRSPPVASPAPWSTTTTVEASPVPSPAPPTIAVAPSPSRDEEAYTIDEIVRASSGVFGKVSAGIGGLIEHTFSQIGRPTGYIVGQEGGGAFLAGLRYGSGTLYLRDGRTMPIHWHGPSLGFDIGAQGAKVMFLVYRLRDPEQLAPTFTSIEGSAFVAGGIGMTLMTNGDAQLAPIRSGIGLRLGASVGYVRFTRKPTWNPF